MKVAVTGGAGYIGSTLIKNLLNSGNEVISLDNQFLGNYSYLKALKNNNLKIIEGDIRSNGHLDKLLKNADVIAHLAALPGLVLCNENPEEAISVNVFGTHKILEAAVEHGINRIVFCSSAAVYGTPHKMPVTEDHRLRPLNLYGVTKLAGEKLMENYLDNNKLGPVSLRFGNVYGVGLYSRWETVIPKFVNLGLEGKPLTIYGDGSSSRDFVHVEDICQAIELSLTVKNIEGEVFNVGSQPTTIKEIAKRVTEEVNLKTGKHIESTYLPMRPGETKEFQYNLSKIKKKIGYKPSWSLEKGIKQLVEYRLKEINK